jgi:hypothetical protein
MEGFYFSISYEGKVLLDIIIHFSNYFPSGLEIRHALALLILELP